MGLYFGRSKSSKSSYDNSSNTISSNFNPDPFKYKIIKYSNINEYLIVMIRYDDCVNYEGIKILVYKDVDLIKLINQKHIDPHFSDSKKFHSPIARFVPTEEGYQMAIKFCNSVTQIEV